MRTGSVLSHSKSGCGCDRAMWLFSVIVNVPYIRNGREPKVKMSSP